MFVTIVSVSKLYIRAAPKYQNLPYSTLFKQGFCQRSSHVKFFSITQGVRYFSNFRIFSLNRPWSTNKGTFGCGHRFRQILSTRLNTLKFSRRILIGRAESLNPLKVNTNIKNNVLLYRFEKPLMFKFATAFGVLTLIGCLSGAQIIYKTLCKNLFNKNEKLKTRLMAHLLPLGIITIVLIAGPGIMYAVWYLVRRNVKYIILHKKGEEVTIITYHPFLKDVKHTIPVKNISCGAGRLASKQYVPLKIQDKKFYYILDKDGQFVNPELFDATCGVSRNFV